MMFENIYSARMLCDLFGEVPELILAFHGAHPVGQPKGCPDLLRADQ